MRIVKPEIQILSGISYGEMLEKLERIGRVCYKSEGNIKEGSAEKFLKNIIARGHESVIEHACLSVLIVCDRCPMRLCATALPVTARRAPGTAITPARNSDGKSTA